MKLSRVDLNLLVVLETIYAEGGITRAAGKLHLSQPAISHSLARLRDLFGDPLFERIGHRMLPTPMTRRLIEPLRHSLESIGAMLNETRTFDPSASARKVVISMSNAVESSVMPQVIKALSTQAPHVSVSTIRMKRSEIEKALAAGALDLAIDVPLAFTEAVHMRRLDVDRLVVVVRKDHPVIRGSIDMPTYLAQRHIMVSGRREGLGIEDLELRKLGYCRDIAWRCQSYFAACATVARTDLVLTMARRHAVMASGSYENQLLETPAVLMPMEAHMYWHSNGEHDMVNRWLRDLVVSCFPDSPQVAG